MMNHYNDINDSNDKDFVYLNSVVENDTVASWIMQGGPPTSYKWGYTSPMSRVITPVTHLVSTIYRDCNP